MRVENVRPSSSDLWMTPELSPMRINPPLSFVTIDLERGAKSVGIACHWCSWAIAVPPKSQRARTTLWRSQTLAHMVVPFGWSCKGGITARRLHTPCQTYNPLLRDIGSSRGAMPVGDLPSKELATILCHISGQSGCSAVCSRGIVGRLVEKVPSPRPGIPAYDYPRPAKNHHSNGRPHRCRGKISH